jgi:iron(III) transport system ATP-binding protein
VEVVRITKRFSRLEIPAVDDISLALHRGEILSILGPSGCGKTTTLRLIAGFERPDAGEVFIEGKLAASPFHWVPPEHRRVGVVFQDYALFPHLTVAQNASFGLSKMPPVERRQRIHQVLEMVGMAELAGRYPYQLSGGQQQRVALARALATRPAVILLDEPFNSLDPDMRVQMRKEVVGILRQEGASAILVTHDQEEAFSTADRVAVMRQGRLEQVDTPEGIYHQPATRFVASFVGLANFLPGVAEDGSVVTELGTFHLACDSTSEDVEVLVRPEQVRMNADETSQAEIIGREFVGMRIMYTVHLPSGILVRGYTRSQEVLPLGLKVQVRAVLERAICFTRN